MAVKTFTSKANLWNQLKELGFDSKQLKSQYDVSYQQANVYLLYDILEQLQNEVGQGVNESLSSCDGGVTGNEVNLTEVIVNQSDVNYIVVTTDYPQVVIKDDYTAKDLTEVTEDQLSDSLYTDKVTAELMFPGTYYQVLEVNSSNIRQELTEYFNNKFEVIVATETSDNDFYVIVHSQADEVYIVTPYCLNPKRLVDCKDKELKDSVYDSKEVAIDEAQEWLNSDYQVVEVDYNYIRCDIKAYFNNRVLVSNGMLGKAYYLPKELAHEQVYYFKGIPIEHFTTEEYSWHTCTIYTAEQPDNTVFLHNNKQHFYLASKDTFGKGYDYDISMSKQMLPMIKATKQYLMTEDEKINQAIEANIPHQYAAVLGGQQQKQVTVSEPLPGSVVLSKSFNYEQELTKLKSLSRQEFMALIQEVQHTAPFSSSYIPKPVVVKKYMTDAEYKAATYLDRNLDNDFELNNDFAVDSWERLMNIQDCFTEAGNYHYSQMQLTPKLHLFSLMTEFVFLMECFLALIYTFNDVPSAPIKTARNYLFTTWDCLINRGNAYYLYKPTITKNDQIKLLNIYHESTSPA